MYDLAIIGGGPAAMTAAVYGARKKLDIVLIAQEIGGQPALTGVVENYMGYQFIEGSELMDKFAEQVNQFPITRKLGEEVSRVTRVGKFFEITSDSGQTYQARAVVYAAGKRPRPLNVPGEERLRGRGVTYCAVCDGPLFEGMKVAVIGGGNSALEATNDMLKIAEQVYLISLTLCTCDAVLLDRAKRFPNLTILLEHEVIEIHGEKQVEAITIRPVKGEETKRLEVRAVFVEVGLIPNSEPVKDLVQLNEMREVVVDSSCRTNIPGFFAAGDVTNVPEKQIVVAAGEGAKAALEAQRYLQHLTPE